MNAETSKSFVMEGFQCPPFSGQLFYTASMSLRKATHGKAFWKVKYLWKFVISLWFWIHNMYVLLTLLHSQTFKYIFTSSSSVEGKTKAKLQLGNANAGIPSMTHVTKASIAYAASQVCFQLLLCCAFLHI